ncbi:hypothetical protein GCM10022261_20480 [Brevibacterium daeguense]|uniref:Uncharacterized protein n=2 Tax=Brevibacterium daeguense TaxID=909936 RepID=A0ABP8EKL0_9MICO
MAACLILATAVPFYLFFTVDVDVQVSQIVTAFIAVAAVYGVFWVVEPVTYFPILGPAGMYQAFMIGNIANKLLPSAIVAQSTIGALPGTKKASFAATAAICGAAVIHVVSMLVLVGLLGTWLVSITPDEITLIAQLYILPAILGGVTVQLIATLKQVRATIIALVISAVVILAIVPVTPPIMKSFAVAIAVIATIIATWFLRDRTEERRRAGAAAQGSAAGSSTPPGAAGGRDDDSTT